MTSKEALAFLDITSPDDSEDAYENALFELKRFFLEKPVFAKTFEGKWPKLERLDEAYVALGNVLPEPGMLLVPDFSPQPHVRNHLLGYYKEKNRLKQRLSVAVSGKEMQLVTSAMIDLERLYAIPFENYTEWTEEQPVMGREPDSMELLEWLREQEQEGRDTLEKLHASKNILPHGLLLALKRLSLLKNYL